MTRHIRIRHSRKLKSPIEKSLRGIGKVYGSESRRSVSLIPMDVIRDQLGPYWDDVPFRKIAFKLCVMGRIKAYGGSWGLPDAPTIEDPFAPFRSKNGEDETISTAKCYVSPVVQPPPVSSSPEITVRDDNVAITESQSPYKQVRKQLADKGYQDKLPDNHPIIVLHSRYLEMGHEKDSQACKNYIANVSRVLKFVSTWLSDRGSPARNWSELMSCSEEPYIVYFEQRERLGQTMRSTSINFLKKLHSLFCSAINMYSLEDKTFPKCFDGGPSQKTLSEMKLLQQKLKIVYSKKLKQQSGELFKRKAAEAGEYPEYSEFEKVMRKIKAYIPDYLNQLEEHFGPGGMVNVSSDKTSTPSQKHLSSIWRKTTCGLAIRLLWISKQRSKVVSNLLKD
ncbi:unnamed protein product [Macrosiphum euphorbiae]|uniref:Uncharacterized protein n=1 Tax=Macrosiphum euphorbiae TaxID=13131 RepID=A0AAV0XPF2_9HEMI|nr:unnamed protein product [Macrosiphum euphorbiae]